MQIFGRSVGGALAAGNACVVKPAETPACRCCASPSWRGCGFPDGALNIVTGYGQAGRRWPMQQVLITSTFTGSARVGTLIAQSAARRHVPVTLERG